MGLAERYPRRLMDAACARAIADGVHSYRHVKALTEKLVAEALAAIDNAPTSLANGPHSIDDGLTQTHPLIRPADEYGELFRHCASQHPATYTTPENSRS